MTKNYCCLGRRCRSNAKSKRWTSPSTSSTTSTRWKSKCYRTSRKNSMTWSSMVAIDILNFCRENTPSKLVLPPQACLHLFRNVIVATTLPNFFLQRVVQRVVLTNFDFFLPRKVIGWLLVFRYYCFWLYDHLVCLVGLSSGHLYLTWLGWRGSFMLGIMRFFVAFNRLVNIRLVLLHRSHFFSIFWLRIRFHLVKFDDCRFIFRSFMLLEWRKIDLLATILLLKLLHFLVTHQMRVFDYAVCIHFRLSVLLFYGSELIVKDNWPYFMVIFIWFDLNNMTDGTVSALRRSLNRKSIFYVLVLMFARQFAYDLLVLKPSCILI